MNKLVVLDAIVISDERSLEQFKRFGTLTIWPFTELHERVDHIGDANIIIANKTLIDKSVIDACPNIQLICLTATGMNSVDVEYAKQKGIVVKNVSGYSTDSVAQYTFTMLLSLITNPHYYDSYVKSGLYSQNKIFTHFGKGYWELKGKRWGIVGLGSIGQKIASIATAFGAEVVYFSTSGNNNNDKYKRVDFDELLSTSNIISINAPLTEKTNKLFSVNEFHKMRNDAILINVGRGPIVDELALVEALNNEEIGGACIDVYETEPLPKECLLLQLKYPERVFLSPHAAWISHEALALLLQKTSENIESFLKN